MKGMGLERERRPDCLAAASGVGICDLFCLLVADAASTDVRRAREGVRVTTEDALEAAGAR